MSFIATTQHEVTDEQVRNLLVGAFEGGSNYWYQIAENIYGGGVVQADFSEDGPQWNPEYPGSLHLYLLPFLPDCGLLINDTEDSDRKPVLLDRAALQRGLDLLASRKTYAHHWRDLIAENDDANTADVFLQLAVLGDVIYG